MTEAVDIAVTGDSFVASASLVGGEPFLKATAHTEGDDRFLYIEPTNEDRDIQGQIVPREVLAKSAAYYRKFGNVDISHNTHPKIVKDKAIANPREWEIGLPVEVRVEPTILVKAQIYAGHEKADWFWNTQVGQRPPMPWWPSIGGASVVNPDGIVTQALWDNIGLDQRPVNKTVPNVTIIPPIDMLKALVGSGGSDTAMLTGAAALRRESLRGAERDPRFMNLSARLISTMEKGGMYLGEDPSRETIHAALRSYFEENGVSRPEAEQYAEQFVTTVAARLRRAGVAQAQAA